MTDAQLESRIARLEAAVGDEQRARWQGEDDRRLLRNAESTRQRLASRGKSLEAFEEKCAAARKHLAERGWLDRLD